MYVKWLRNIFCIIGYFKEKFEHLYSYLCTNKVHYISLFNLSCIIKKKQEIRCFANDTENQHNFSNNLTMYHITAFMVVGRTFMKNMNFKTSNKNFHIEN